MRRQIDLDQVGAAASFACAVHCAALPIAISLSAGGVISFLDNQPVEWGLVLLAAVIGTASAWRGYRRHGNKTVAVVLASAALGLVLATYSRHGGAHDPENVMAVLSGRSRGPHDPSHLFAWVFPLIGLVIAVAHVVNLRLCRACRACDAHEHAPAKAPR
jgi:hypothetical protein